MTITNIYPLNKIDENMIRQPVEMYLPLQILHNKEQYKFLKFDKTKKIDVYKICDTNVGDPQYSKGKPCTLEEQLEAASIIDADEITLTDLILFDQNGMKPTNDSFALSIESYHKFINKYQKDFPNLKLGWVIQAEDFESWKQTVQYVVQLEGIETILIPKWECYTSMWGLRSDHRGRTELTYCLREIEKSTTSVHHRVHWLGNANSPKANGICEYLIPKDLKNKIDVQSTDTGLWIAELSQFGKVDLFKPRPEKPFEIDLLHGELDRNDVVALIAEQNKILNY